MTPSEGKHKSKKGEKLQHGKRKKMSEREQQRVQEGRRVPEDAVLDVEERVPRLEPAAAQQPQGIPE
jgi:hypothetical protein